MSPEGPAEKPIECAGAVVRDGAGRLLLVQRGRAPSAGLWSLPGGRVEPGETAAEAAAREVTEETGLVVEVHELLATVTGTGCMSSALTGCFLAMKPQEPLAAAAEALVAFGVAGEDAAEGARGPGSFHVGLYDALAALDPETLDGRARVDR